jgi:hypothetical protein
VAPPAPLRLERYGTVDLPALRPPLLNFAVVEEGEVVDRALNSGPKTVVWSCLSKALGRSVDECRLELAADLVGVVWCSHTSSSVSVLEADYVARGALSGASRLPV